MHDRSEGGIGCMHQNIVPTMPTMPKTLAGRGIVVLWGHSEESDILERRTQGVKRGELRSSISMEYDSVF